MATLLGNENFLVVSGVNCAFIHDRKNDSMQRLEPPGAEEIGNGDKAPKKGETSQEHADKHMACVALSDCGKFLALSSSKGKKSLHLWRLEDQTWKFVSQRLIGRAASKIRFNHSASAVLVADKAGDVYSFSVTDPEKEKEWLLGHIAMLLDVLVVGDDRFVITCDRDDKIRVARFPNCYCIQSYCLGHTSFINSLVLLPHDNSFLISTSGDGTVKIWKYLDGKEVLSISINKYIEPLIEDPLPVKQCSALKTSDNSSLISVCVGSVSKCLVLEVEGSESLSVKSSYVIDTGSEEVWWTHLAENRHLYILKNSQDRPVDTWSWSDDYCAMQLDEVASKSLNFHANMLQECFSTPSIPSMLYRKKYDEPPEKAKRIK